MGFHSTSVANRFLQLASAKGQKLTQMQLQKLVYIAHGWSLAILGRPLTSDSVCAWDYGPVYPELWQSLKRYGREPVLEQIKVRDFGLGAFSANADQVSSANLDVDTDTLVSQVFENYGQFHAFQLSAMTHENGTPWHQVYVEDGAKKGKISDEKIREHFIDIARKRSAA
ncbi:Panacea domain-containing protein [Ponticoccus alexandrii]|uniref:DUF4065 domain-containing protein n=1 Tax=Ponticoccus alexandrii TaxID=1943633 RepID=A0ABX7FCN4_9RHOB|nr:type II toxin-antitoxin system antitoxin SocA domain-containing protein [Ponticoccus alexandrii]ETA49703.2 hypothetical protein P279_23385 [Rhodobacteraceae bacterium PD-2]QRF68143.1 DUF4065 domain-containing protein [Ponticoccus alexandrii]